MSVVKDDVEDEIISPQKDHAIKSNFFKFLNLENIDEGSKMIV